MVILRTGMPRFSIDAEEKRAVDCTAAQHVGLYYFTGSSAAVFSGMRNDTHATRESIAGTDSPRSPG